MKRAISILINLIISLSIFSVSLFTVNATPPTSRYEICGDYSYIILADGTASIEDYGGTATSIDIPSQLDGYKVTSLGRFSFYDFDNLESVTIHESVTNIDDSAFRKCDNLYEIKIDSDNPVFDSRENCNAIIESETNTLISGCNGTIIPCGVTSIAPSAFSGCTNLTSITIPNGVTSIGGAVFFDCKNLSSVTFSESVTNLGENPFFGCVNLSEIKIDSNNPAYDSRENCNAIIESSTNTLFAGCKNTVIPESVTTIAKEAFYTCENLTIITVPQGVTSIGDNAFNSCINLTSITIPDSVTSIGESIFHYCLNLSEIKVDSNNKFFDSRENCNAIIESKTNTLIAGCKDTVIPENVTGIGNNAFSGCANLESIIIPDNVTSIGENAFYGCANLESIIIPDNMISIGENAFYGCTNLESITIPDNVTSIGEDAFYVYGGNICLYVAENSHAHKYAKQIGCNYKLTDTPDNDSTSETTAAENSVVSDNAANSDNSGNKDVAKSNAYFFIVIAILLCAVILLLTAVIVLSILLYKKTRARSCLNK